MILARLGVKLYLRHHRQAKPSEVYRKHQKPPSPELVCNKRYCPARQIFAVWLQEAQGLSIKEIAERLRTTVDGAKSLLRHIRDRKDFMRMLPENTRKDFRRRTKSYEDWMEGEIERQF
jgi:hypothetical protein